MLILHITLTVFLSLAWDDRLQRPLRGPSLTHHFPSSPCKHSAMGRNCFGRCWGPCARGITYFLICSLLLAFQLLRLGGSKRDLFLKITANYLAQDGRQEQFVLGSLASFTSKNVNTCFFSPLCFYSYSSLHISTLTKKKCSLIDTRKDQSNCPPVCPCLSLEKLKPDSWKQSGSGFMWLSISRELWIWPLFLCTAP